CLGQPCLSLRDPMGPAQGDWHETQPPRLAAPVYRDSDGFMPGPARSAQYLFAHATRHGEEPAFGSTADEPQMIFVISKNIDGQDRTINGLLQQPNLLDDAVSALWTRCLQATPDAIEWRTLAVPRRGRTTAQPAAAPSPAQAPANLPRFEDYPATLYDGAHNSSRRLDSKQAALQSEVPDFAGEFIVYNWGCGTGCGMTGFVSKKNGRELEQTFNMIHRSSPL